MYYYLYKITNKINGKIYIGVHKAKKINDGYMGSGKVIRSAIEKHGVENFEKEILEFFDDRTSMYDREKEVVNAEFLMREDTYNLRRGGTGGFDFINETGVSKFRGKIHTEETCRAIGQKRKQAVEAGTFVYKPLSAETKTKISEKKLGQKYKSKPKSEEHRQKLAESIKRVWAQRKSVM